MPAIFIGHGSPTNAIEDNPQSRAWRDLGTRLPRPRAILAISAHWFTRGTAVTAMAAPRTIHDFGNFPPAMYQLQYPAPGSPELAAQVAELLAPEPVILDEEQWGLDHGTWAVLMHVFPKADIPVVQLSLNGLKRWDDHLALAKRLVPLREQGVLIFASGQIVHNFREVDFSMGERGHPWAVAFEEEVHRVMTTEPENVLNLLAHPDYRRASPTPDHFLPLIYLAALASPEEPARAFFRNCSIGSSSLSSYAVGLPA